MTSESFIDLVCEWGRRHLAGSTQVSVIDVRFRAQNETVDLIIIANLAASGKTGWMKRRHGISQNSCGRTGGIPPKLRRCPGGTRVESTVKASPASGHNRYLWPRFDCHIGRESRRSNQRGN